MLRTAEGRAPVPQIQMMGQTGLHTVHRWPGAEPLGVISPSRPQQFLHPYSRMQRGPSLSMSPVYTGRFQSLGRGRRNPRSHRVDRTLCSSVLWALGRREEQCGLRGDKLQTICSWFLRKERKFSQLLYCLKCGWAGFIFFSTG